MKDDKGRRAPRRATTAAAVALAALLSACGQAPPGLDFIRAHDSLKQGSVAGRNRDWLKDQTGKPIRIHDVVRRTLPASPPSHLEYEIDVPPGARFSVACGIPEDRHDKPGVEFVVKLRKDGKETVLATELLDPMSKPKHRRWVPLSVDLSKYAGRGTLILETRGFEDGDDPRRAFWGAPTLTSPKRKAPLTIVYLVDTLRADHTTPYGYARDTTPELARFAQDAVVFEKAITTASWTKPAVASIFTSQLPGRHRAVQLRDQLSEGHATLAELLEKNGFSTGAAIANSVIYSAGTQFEQGFDTYSGLHGAGDRVTKTVEAGPVIDAAVEWLDTRAGLPGFFYVHTMDPHVPYTPPAPFDRKYEPYVDDTHPGADPRTDYKEPADRDRMIAQYDGEIAYGDQEFGRLVRELKARGQYDDALIIFTADHGEEFLDHGQWTHGKSVFDELVHVPLIVKFPKNRDAGRRIDQQVRTMDILPTVLEAMGLPAVPNELISGRALQAVVRGGTAEPPAVSEISHRGYVAYGMRTAKNKYVRRFSPQEDELFFDLVADPKERASRLADHLDQARTMRGHLEEAMVESPYRHHLKFVGGGVYSIVLRSGGWLEGVEPVGFGASEKYNLAANRQTLTTEVRPRPGQPRELMLSVRPMGAPVWVSGTRDGRPLTVNDVFMAEEGLHPAQIPFKLPEIESENERENVPAQLNMLAPPKGEPAGLHLWLKLRPGMKTGEWTQEICERMKALNYVSKC